MKCQINCTKMRLVIISILALLFTSACYYDNEEDLFPTLSDECDTSLVSYSIDVRPVLESNCYACHSNLNSASLGSNIKLEDFSDVANQSSLILSAIKHESDVSPMPKGSAQLIRCSQMKIEAWVNQGNPEN